MPFPTCSGMHYPKFLTQLVKARGVERYLEIGVMFGDNLALVETDFAVGVDPGFDLRNDVTVGKREVQLFRTTSDAFFKMSDHWDFDLAFLDGLHQFEFLLRDIANAEQRSTRNGLLLAHDCIPTDANMVNRVPTPPAWSGDVWKVIPILEKWRPDLRLVLIDCHPTGLLAITHLDPSSTVINDHYLEIMDEFRDAPNDEAALQRFYEGRAILPADVVLAEQSLYFRT